jgi:hypothetical protein
MKRFLISFFITIGLLSIPIPTFADFFRPGKAAVKIGDRRIILTKETSCKAEHWGEKDGCRCCILKHALKRDGTFNTSGDYIKTCIKKDRCTRVSIQQLEEELRVKDEELPQEEGQPTLKTSGGFRGDGAIVEAIVNEARAIAPVKIDVYSDDASGNLSPEGVKRALVGLIPESKDVIQKMIVKPLGSGGAQTDQLFGVFLQELGEEKQTLKYIVKGLKKIAESRNLEELKRDFGPYSLSNSKKSKDFLSLFPAIAMSFGTTYYADSKGKRHYITVMPAAPGKPLHDITEGFVKDFYLPYQEYRKKVREGAIVDFNFEAKYEKALKATRKAFSVLGDRLGRFHAAGMTYKNGHLTGFSHNVHGDFHSNNVFYGKVGEKEVITFIDPETLVISFKKPRDVARDLRHFYLYLTLHFKTTQNVARLVADKGFWHEQFIQPFLLAYVGGYGPYKVGNEAIKPTFSWKIDALKIVERSLLSFSGSSEDIGQSIGAIPFGFWTHQRKELRKIFHSIQSHHAKAPKD